MTVGMIGLFMYVGRVFKGATLATLPFEAHAWLRRLTQRGLEDPALTDCSAVRVCAVSRGCGRGCLCMHVHVTVRVHLHALVCGVDVV